MTKTYNKLIRDNIPDIIKQSGKSCDITTLNDEQFFECLNDKLMEEVNEYLQSPDIQELADILEVVITLSNILDNEESLHNIRMQKQKTNGGFNKKLYLTKVYDNE
jgi:predicted house-cleaning noncanonical NTP pyrophosphatase (MazG superfamily)